MRRQAHSFFNPIRFRLARRIRPSVLFCFWLFSWPLFILSPVFVIFLPGLAVFSGGVQGWDLDGTVPSF